MQKVLCAVCSRDPETGRIGSHETNHLCDDCQGRPENAGWSSRDDRELDEDPSTEVVAERRALVPSGHQRRALNAEQAGEVLLLVASGKWSYVEQRDALGRKRGCARRRTGEWSTRELAGRYRVSHMTIWRTLGRALRRR